MDFISKVNLFKLAEMIGITKKQLYLCLPAIPKIVSDAVIKLKEEHPNVKINLLVDFDPQTFRQGYGEFDAISELFKAKIPVSTLSDNRVSFIISDYTGYYLYIESQYLVPAEKETYNAILVDSVSMVKLKQHFYGSTTEDYTNELSNAIIEVYQELKKLDESKQLPPAALTKQINDDDKKKVEGDIKKNPPMEPDHKRILDVYSNKFQYVDLKFSGVNIKDKEVTIPKDLLPIRDENLKQQLKSTLKVINKDIKLDDFEGLETLNDKLNEIRKKYLVRSSVCERNVLKKEERDGFEHEISNLKEEIPNLHANIINALYDELERTKNRFKKEVYELVIQNPEIVFDKNSLWFNNIRLVEQAARQKANDAITKIKWPDYFKLVEKMTIKTFYSDITIDDLYNKEILAEFKKKGLISEADIKQLATFTKTVKVCPK